MISNMTYTVPDLCEIIKACHENGVSRFQLADLRISFKGQAPQKPEQVVPLSPEEEKVAETHEKEAFVLSEAEIRERQLETLRLADPEAFEELIAKGELENARQESHGIDAG